MHVSYSKMGKFTPSLPLPPIIGRNAHFVDFIQDMHMIASDNRVHNVHHERVEE